MGHMRVTGQDDLGSRCGEIRQGFGGLCNVGRGAISGRDRGMMHDGNPVRLGRGTGKCGGQSRHGRSSQSTGLPDKGIGSIYPLDHGIGQGQGRLDPGPESLAIPGEWGCKPNGQIVERHVVISRDDQNRPRKPSKIGASRRKLRRAGALGQIARDDDGIGTLAGRKVEQRLDQTVVHGTEV